MREREADEKWKILNNEKQEININPFSPLQLIMYRVEGLLIIGLHRSGAVVTGGRAGVDQYKSRVRSNLGGKD